mmetsp:Transcript_25925/g.54060  ORF Transcript_25925/g.54060 Transcript_25925/m.54060 type:complete len:435 (+) Transcript_25925:409-1713(+)
MNLLLQGINLGVIFQERQKVLELGTRLFLNLGCNLNGFVQEQGNLFKVRFDHSTGGQGGGTNTDSTGGDSGSISRHTILVECDRDSVANLFKLGSSQAHGLQIPKHQVIFGTARSHFVSQRSQFGTQSGGILLDLLRVDFEIRCHDFLQLSGNTSNLVNVGTTLQGRKDGLVNGLFKVAVVLTEENHTGTWSTQRLVRGGGNHIAKFKGRGLFRSGHQTGNVSHIHHQQGSIGISDFSESLVIIVTRVGRSSRNNHGWLEQTGITFQLFIVNVSRFGVDTVGKTFKVDRSGGNGLACAFLFGVGVKSVRQVSARWQIETHDAVMRAQESRVDGKVSGRARVGLDIDAPFFRIQSVGGQGAFLAHDFDLIDHLITSVITSVWETFRILVRQGGSQTVHDGAAGEVFRGNQFQRTPLARLFLFNQIIKIGIVFFEG